MLGDISNDNDYNFSYHIDITSLGPSRIFLEGPSDRESNDLK